MVWSNGNVMRLIKNFQSIFFPEVYLNNQNYGITKETECSLKHNFNSSGGNLLSFYGQWLPQYTNSELDTSCIMS